jgi:hypothetical protein
MLKSLAKKPVIVVASLLLALLVIVGLIIYLQPKPWPELPEYPRERAQWFNVRTITKENEKVTTFEVYEIDGNSGLKAILINYSSALWDAGWNDPIIGNRIFYFTRDSRGIYLFGQTFFASCPPFRLELNIEPLDLNQGHFQITVRQVRNSCN